MSYLTIDEVRAFNIEHTSRCNLKCPQCARVVDGKINPMLNMQDVSLGYYKWLFPKAFCNQLDFIFFCGNYGDPIASATFFDCAKYLAENGVRLSIHTNGSLRGTRYWKELASILNSNGKVIFSIDGLSDTNSKYRVNSNFEKIIENVKSFIRAGGIARWDYLVFDHNYHQVEEARGLAKKLGFKSFNEKKTKRFINNKNYKSNKGEGKFGSIIERYGSWKNYIDQTKISCRYKKDKTLYIDFDMNVWPCCWVGAPLFFYGDDNIQKNQLLNLMSKYEEGFNSLYYYSLEEILNHRWFKYDLMNSWSKTMDEGKLMTCGRTCGTEYKFSGDDDSNKKEMKL